MKRVLLFLYCILCITNIYAQTPQEEERLWDNIELIKEKSGQYSDEYINALDEIARYYGAKGEYAKGVEINSEILVLTEQVYGRYSEKYALFQGNMLLLYGYMSKYEDVKKMCNSILDTYSNIPEIHFPKVYTSSLSTIGSMFMMIGEYDDAERVTIKAIEEIDKYKVGDLATKSVAYEVLGIIYLRTGRYSKAEKYMLEGLAIVPHDHPEYAKLLNNMGLLYYYMGRYNKAKEYFVLSYEEKKQSLSENHPLLGSSLSNIGIVSLNDGDYELAERSLLKALDMQKESLGEKHRDYANSLTNIGILYSEMGDYDKAIHYSKAGQELLGEILGLQHLDYAGSLSGTGNIYLITEDYSNALADLSKALEIQQHHSRNHPESLGVMTLLGSTYIMCNDFKSAKTMLEDALSLAERTDNRGSRYYAEALYLLGVLYDKVGDYEQSEAYYQQALLTYENAYSTEHNRYVTTINSLGELYQKTSNYDKAQNCFLQASESGKKQFVASMNYMSERQRSLFWDTIRDRHESTYPKFVYEYYQTSPEIASFAYNNELFVKGLLLQSASTVHNSIVNSGDDEMIQKWENLKIKNSQILSLKDNAQSVDYLLELQKEAEELEKELTVSSAAFRDNMNMLNITWEDVRASLATNQVAVEFFVAPITQQKKVYCALLLRSDSSYPILIPLCEAEDFNAIIEVNPSDIYDYSKCGQHIANMIWRPLMKYIDKGETISFAPAGYLHQLAIESLPYDEHSLMQEHYNIERISSTRELAISRPAQNICSAVLYGGLQYDMDGEELLAESEEYLDSAFTARSVKGLSQREAVQYLPGSKNEVCSVNDLLVHNNINTKLFVGTKGTEESFKSLDGEDCNIVHIATHGFFWSDNIEQSANRDLYRMLNADKRALPVDPLDSCGLLLSGANISLLGDSEELPDGVQDGILTAKEISLLNLSQVQIAILSACETGKGEIRGEGVFGLQRALKQAGVRTIIMSLWAVDDNATQLLMENFYSYWIEDKLDKREAFYKAQIAVRNQFNDPKYWASFVLLD